MTAPPDRQIDVDATSAYADAHLCSRTTRTPRGPTTATRWRVFSGLEALEARAGTWAIRRGPFISSLYEFVRFGLKQAWACLFGGVLLGLILVTRLEYPPDALLPRYDALLLASVIVQILFIVFGLETVAEAKVILVFHLVGTGMELFKTSVGSWHYLEFSYFRLGGVPLFSGFMYGAVGSYMFRIWRLLAFHFLKHPPLAALAMLSVGIYANFFADHWGVDFRFALLVVVLLLFRRTTIYFRIWTRDRHMPLLLGFFLVALFIWFGENLATAGGAWLYPNQVGGWHPVAPTKLTSWFLLMLISYTLVAIATLRGSDRSR